MQVPAQETLPALSIDSTFHMWNGTAWVTFTEHVRVDLSLQCASESDRTAKLVVSRANGTPMTSCSFALPIDSSVWKLAHLDTALIITHTSGNGTSKIMLQTEQQATLDNLISRLRQYSQQARLALEATSVLGTWMAQSEYAHQNDSSLDESTTASVEEPSIFDPAFVPFVSLPAQAFSESAPMTYTQQTQSMIVPPHALSTPVTSVPNSHGPAYMAVDQMDGQGPIQELHHELQLEFGEEMDDMAQAWQPDGLAHVAYFAPGVQQTLLPSLSEYDQFNDIVHEAWADWDTLTAQERQAFEPEL